MRAIAKSADRANIRARLLAERVGQKVMRGTLDHGRHGFVREVGAVQADLCMADHGVDVARQARSVEAIHMRGECRAGDKGFPTCWIRAATLAP